MVNGIAVALNSKYQHPFILNKSINDLKVLLKNNLPDTKTIYKFISISGGFASISFIKYVAGKEIIEELTASTLRIGQKQFYYLEKLADAKRIKKAKFFIGSKSIMEGKRKYEGKYGYFENFENCCKRNNWEYLIVNNHSKIILMKTKNNHYVLETSSNLNENPKIEQYSFENNKDLYDFYYNFFEVLKAR